MRWAAFVSLLFMIFTASCAGHSRDVEIVQVDSAIIKYRKLREDTARIRQLQAECKVLLERDQYYRKKYGAMLVEGKMDSMQSALITDKVRKADSINMDFAARFIAGYGWPAKDIAGEECSNTFFLLIQHADLEQQEKFFPVVVDAVNKGNCSKKCVPYLLDRILIKHGGKQYYGTQLSYDKIRKRYDSLPLADSSHVDDLRELAGLMPLSEYLAMSNAGR